MLFSTPPPPPTSLHCTHRENKIILQQLNILSVSQAAILHFSEWMNTGLLLISKAHLQYSWISSFLVHLLSIGASFSIQMTNRSSNHTYTQLPQAWHFLGLMRPFKWLLFKLLCSNIYMLITLEDLCKVEKRSTLIHKYFGQECFSYWIEFILLIHFIFHAFFLAKSF